MNRPAMERTVLFGLDGATFDILDPLMRDGTMPHLAAFAAEGVRAPLQSTPHPVTPPSWTSMVTGRGPGHHGILDFIRAEERPQGMYFRITNATDVRCETIWSLASRHGRRVTALNFYGMAPPRPLNGFSISGFVPGRHIRRATWPPDLFDRLAAMPGFDGRELGMNLDEEKKCIQGLSPEFYERWITMHIRRERRWFETLAWLMEREPCDLTAIVFDGVDKLQHLCWRFIDPSLFPAAPTAWEQRVRGLCLDYFRQVDGFLGEVVRLAGPEARLFIASDHGFGASVETVYINVWLERQGLLRWAGDAPKDESGSIMVDRMKTHVTLLDWKATRAYALTPSSNGIFIRGVAPAEYAAFRDRLADALRSFRDEATGEPIVTEVRTREQIYPGAQMSLAPDLTVTLRDGGLVSILNAPAPVAPRPEPVGTHRPQGIFLARGAGIRRAGAVASPLSVLDVTPALVHSLGLAVPSDYERPVPEEIFETAWLAAHPVRSGPAGRPPAEFAAAPTGAAGASRKPGASVDGEARRAGSGVPVAAAEEAPGTAAAASAPGGAGEDEDEAIIMERLRQLGYVE